MLLQEFTYAEVNGTELGTQMARFTTLHEDPSKKAPKLELEATANSLIRTVQQFRIDREVRSAAMCICLTMLDATMGVSSRNTRLQVQVTTLQV